MDALFKEIDKGGLVVVPSAPVLVEMPNDPAHREALVGSDLAIIDSGFLALLRLVLRGENLRRLSGLRVLRALVERSGFRQPGATFWIMPSERDSEVNRVWLNQHGVIADQAAYYIAPWYPGGRLEDPSLLGLVEERRPKYVMINLGGGVQERLGYYLRTSLSYQPAIICTGAAIAFLSGQQTRIPAWADRLMLGWLFRTIHSPTVFLPRYWHALRLVALLLAAEKRD